MSSFIEKLHTKLLENFYLCQRMGADSFGNTYYERLSKNARPKRWVLYKGRAEGSKIPPEWHLWLHHTTASPPQKQRAYPWQKPHQPNLSGTSHAYKPAPSRKKPAYQAWTPNENKL